MKASNVSRAFFQVVILSALPLSAIAGKISASISCPAEIKAGSAAVFGVNVTGLQGEEGYILQAGAISADGGFYTNAFMYGNDPTLLGGFVIDKSGEYSLTPIFIAAPETTYIEYSVTLQYWSPKVWRSKAAASCRMKVVR